VTNTSTRESDFEALYDRFRPRIVRYLSRLVGESEAEDLAQSVMVKVSEGLPSFRGDSNLSTWIYRIATNVGLDALRRKAARPQVENEVDLGEEEVPQGAQVPSAETAATREEMNACIREFIERLPENYRMVITLSEIEGFTNEEITQILGISLDAVKIRLHRAREKLRRELGDGCSFDRGDDGELACERKSIVSLTYRRKG